MLRFVIGLGLLLMLAGFGAAGWQFVASKPSVEVSADGSKATARVPNQNWLISPTGGLIQSDDVRAYLRQDKFVASRRVVITQTGLLSDLLSEGEKLPDVAYLEVLADIRAPKLAERHCAVLIEMNVAACALNAAGVVKGSVDPSTGTARFRIELVYRLPSDADVMPDLTSTAMDAEWTDFDVPSDKAENVDALIRSAMAEVADTCAAGAKPAEACRLMQLDLIWYGSGTAAARAYIGRMVPLPKGVYPAPPLG